FLQFPDNMPVDVAAYIDRHRKSCNMCRISIDMNCQSCCSASKSARTDSKTVDLFQHFLFQFPDIRNRGMSPGLTCQCLLSHQCAFFKSSPDTDSYHHRRTGIRTRLADRL